MTAGIKRGDLASQVPGFYWIVDPREDGIGLAGLRRPGTVHALLLREAGCRLIVNLEEPSWHGRYAAPDGIRWVPFPIIDNHTPGWDRYAAVLGLCEQVHAEAVAAGGSGFVALHCALGIGRTGTIGACYLTYLRHVAAHPAGLDARSALTRVGRRLGALYPDKASIGPNRDQEKYVVRFEEWLRAGQPAQNGGGGAIG